MIGLRPFSEADLQSISQYQYPTLPKADIKALIAQWNKRQYDGKFFEMLAVVWDGNVVGYTSLLAQEYGCVSEGIEIYVPFRRQGYALAALKELMEYASSLGYRTVTAQIRQDNAASLALHEKLGFQIVDRFINKRGKAVFSLSRPL